MSGDSGEWQLKEASLEGFCYSQYRQYPQDDYSATETLTVMIAAIAFISLLVGGIGVMNSCWCLSPAHRRDWHPHGSRCAKKRHPSAVFDRGSDYLLRGGRLGALA
jgi:hypothetical protein